MQVMGAEPEWQPVEPGGVRALPQHRRALAGHIDHPDGPARCVRAVGHLLVGGYHQAAPGQWQAGVGGATVPGQVRHLMGAGDVGHVQHHHPGVVVTEVGAMAIGQGVVCGVPLPGRPGWFFVLPLAGPPPPGGYRWPGRVGQVQHHPDPVAETIGDGREVRVPATGPHHPVHAPAAAGPERDLLGPQRVGEAVDGQPGRERPGCRCPVRELLVVDHQQAARHLHFVGVAIRWRGPLGRQPGPGGIGGVQDCGAHPGGAGVPDVHSVTVPDHLHAVAVAAEVVLGEQAQPSGAGGPRPAAHARVAGALLTRPPSWPAAQSAAA
jgi:hypothetical protein